MSGAPLTTPGDHQGAVQRSLHDLGNRQSEPGLPEAALASAEEALEAIWPFFLRLPAAFERNTGLILDNLRNRLTALGRPPTPALLQRIAAFEAARGSRPAPP